MTALEYVGLGIICALAFAIRTLPSSSRRWFGNDTYSNLLVARQFKKDGKFPKTYPLMFPANEHTYPPLFQAILGPFAYTAERAAIRFLAPAFDVLTTILVYSTGVWMGIQQPLFPALFYALSYANVLEATTLSVRPFANLLLAANMLAMGLFADSANWEYLLVVVLLEALILLSHKMTVQVLVPLHLVVAILLIISGKVAGISLLVALPVAFGLAALLTRGRYLTQILPDHIRYIRLHLRRGDYRSGKKQVPSPLRLVKSNPLAYAAPFVGILLFIYGHPIKSGQVFLSWSIVVLVLSQFWIWGDSWRYLQIGTFPAVLIITQSVGELDLTHAMASLALAAISAALAAGCVLQLRGTLRRDIAQRLANALESLSPEWKNKLSGARVFSNVRHFLIPYFTGASVLIGDPSAKGMELSFRVEEKAKTSFREIAEWSQMELKEPIDYFLVFEGFPTPKTDGFVPVFESGLISVYAVAGI